LIIFFISTFRFVLTDIHRQQLGDEWNKRESPDAGANDRPHQPARVTTKETETLFIASVE